MSSYNKIVLVGRLTQDPELKYTQNGKATARFSLAVDRPSAAKETDFFNITAWERLAETCGRFLAKGKLVLIEGRLQNREYTGNDGQQRKITEIVASDMRMLGSKSENGGMPEGAAGGRPYEGRPPMQEQAPASGGAPSARPAPKPVPAQGPDEGIDDLGMDDIPF